MLKIRLMRIGAKKKPFYRVVAMHERSKRTGGYLELLGTYDPLTTPHDIKLKQDRIDYWIKQGAQMSVGFLRIIGKAPQRPPRKPKKEQKKETPTEAAPAADTVPAEETGGAAKPETAEATGVVESAPEEGVSEDSTSQQTGSESQESTSEPESTEASDASQSGEQSTGPVAQTQVEETK